MHLILTFFLHILNLTDKFGNKIVVTVTPHRARYFLVFDHRQKQLNEFARIRRSYRLEYFSHKVSNQRDVGVTFLPTLFDVTNDGNHATPRQKIDHSIDQHLFHLKLNFTSLNSIHIRSNRNFYDGLKNRQNIPARESRVRLVYSQKAWRAVAILWDEEDDDSSRPRPEEPNERDSVPCWA